MNRYKEYLINCETGAVTIIEEDVEDSMMNGFDVYGVDENNRIYLLNNNYASTNTTK